MLFLNNAFDLKTLELAARMFELSLIPEILSKVGDWECCIGMLLTKNSAALVLWWRSLSGGVLTHSRLPGFGEVPRFRDDRHRGKVGGAGVRIHSHQRQS